MPAPRAFPAAAAAVVSVFASSALPARAQHLTRSDTTSFLALDDVAITPDQRYAVVRQNNANGYALVFDLSTGLPVAAPATSGAVCGDVVDAVAVTNDRAIVLGGDRALVFDLTPVTGPVVLAAFLVGYRPNDVAVTPDGRFAAVRGGTSIPGNPGGQFLFDLQNALQVGHAPGDPPLYDYSGNVPYSYDTDSVAVTDQFAVMLSIVGQSSASPRTRVSIWDLTLPGGPAVTFATGQSVPDIFGAPHDVAITPDGVHAVVRSEFAVAAFTLPGAMPALLWAARPFQGPGPFDDAALDSVEASNTRIVTISKVTNPLLPQGSQVDVFDFAGNQRHARMPGIPHDLAITPDGKLALVHTTAGLSLYDITVLPAGQQIQAVAAAPAPSSTSGYQGGLDSLVASNRHAVMLTHSANLQDTDVWFFGIAHGGLDFLALQHISGSRPTDLAITPDGRKVVVTGNSSIDVFHLATGGRGFQHKPVGPNLWYQWCNGVAASDTKAVGIGQHGSQSGWIDVVDMTPIHQSFCAANANSTGESASITALGNASVSANSLKLGVEGVPPHARGRFVYGAGQTQIPFGDGLQCVTAPAFGLRILDVNAAGAGFLPVNYAAQTIPAAMITAGSTWNFQFVYADRGSSGFGVNSSNGLSITFVP